MDFLGTVEQLTESIRSLNPETQIENLPNHTRFRTTDGVVINWYPKQKRVHFQGKREQALALEKQLSSKLALLGSNVIPTDPSTSGNDHDVKKTYTYRKPEEKVPPLLAPPAYIPNEDSELVIALVAAVGTDLSTISNVLKERLQSFRYTTTQIKISSDIISDLRSIPESPEFDRINTLMTTGNEIRRKTGDYSVLAKLASAKINQTRKSVSNSGKPEPIRRRAFVISSLKHPAEVTALRKIYASGFFVIGVHGSEKTRFEYLRENKQIPEEQVKELLRRDEDEAEKYGQHTRDTYHLSDFFVDFGENRLKLERDVWRILDLIFGKPFVTPTFDEFAMFMAFSASLRSADLSRQVGAVVAQNNAIVATGANDVPQYGGGLYWPGYYGGNEIVDVEDGRDYVRGGDTNVLERNDIIEDILSKIPADERDKMRSILAGSKLKNITEYGRVVHAEMEALLSCARGHIGTKGTHLYCTTFPCHNCAKHIVAAGVAKVVYVEPYPKSKAIEFHKDSITLSTTESNKVVFEPFVGVGPRSFFNLFSVNLGTGYEIKRKNDDGKRVDWKMQDAKLRMQMLPISYIERESITTNDTNKFLEILNEPE